MVEISTSLLKVDKQDIVQVIHNLESAKTDYFHIDVMDGIFVKNNTNELMQEYCGYIKNISTLPLDVHLMVSDVESYIKSYLVFEPNIITFHLEAVKNEKQIIKLINFIKQNNCKVGISIKPETDIKEVYKFLPYIHMCLIMTVEPGMGGQTIIENMIGKIKELKLYIDNNNLNTDIQVDGGINLENIKKIKDAGCNIIVSGTTITESDDYKKTIKKMKE